MRRTLCLTLLCVSLLTAPAVAQWNNTWINPYTGGMWNNPISSYLDTVIQGSMRMKALEARYGRQSGEGQGAGAPQAEAQPAPETTRFQPVGRHLLVDSFSKGLGGDAEQQQAFRQLFTETLEGYEQQTAGTSLHHDLAGAMAMYVAVHYSAYHGGVDIGADAFETTANQLRAVLDSDAMRNSSDEEKQQLYEMFLLFAAFTGALHEAAVEQGDDELAAQMRQFGGDGLRYVLQTDPRNVRMTDAGLAIDADPGVDLIFTAPAGWERQDSDTFSAFTRVDEAAKRFTQIQVYHPSRASGDLAADFESEVQELLLAKATPQGDLALAQGETARGYPWVSGMAPVTDADGLSYTSRLYVVAVAPQALVSVRVNTGDAATLNAAERTLTALLDSLAARPRE